MSNKIAVLVSGGGRSLENLARLEAQGDLNAELALVVSDRAGAFAIERAAKLKISSKTIDAARTLSPPDFSSSIFEAIEDAGCDLVVLAGFLRFLPIPESWTGRVMNIHPSLLPAFGGKGYYGDRVHTAVLERGVKFSGCTVHYVDNVYDNGPIAVQRVIPVQADDTVESLGSRVFEEEKLALPAAINLHFSAKA